jgi:pSer/pThr/pTyr-binding forkhead associated (FHA) protein
MQSIEPLKHFDQHSDGNESATDRFWLILAGISPRLWSHEIRESPMQLGRGVDCDIILDDGKVSRSHALISRENAKVRVRDCGSRNGTFIDNLRIDEVWLERGNNFTVGDLELIVVDLDLLNKELMNTLEQSTFIDESPVAARASLNAYRKQRLRALELLTSSQKRVLKAVLDGLSEKEIAVILYLSPDTVHSHMKLIYKSFQVTSRAELLSRFIDPAARQQI